MIFDDDLQANDDWLLNELAKIGTAEDDDEIAVYDDRSKLPAIRKPVGAFTSPDRNDPDIILDEVRITRWDKASRKWRDLRAKRDALPADTTARKVALLDEQIRIARQAIKRAEGDVSRRQEEIDQWRADAGREEYNAKRRKVRQKPNTDLTDLTDAEKDQRKKDQRADGNWLKRQRSAGITEAQIQAKLVIRIQARDADRAAQALEEKQQIEMEALPNFGIM